VVRLHFCFGSVLQSIKLKMPMHKQFILFFVVLLLLANTAYSQNTLRLSFLNESTNVPSYKILTFPIHPGITIGTDFWIKEREHWQKTLGVDASFYHHRLSENAIMLDGSFSVGYRFRFGLQPKFLAAMGYKQSFAAGEIYELKDGAYESTNPLQRAQFNMKLGFGLDYKLNERLSLNVDYRSMLASPFSESLPFSLHNIFRVGLILSIKK
jgi:hypothetical protein